MLRSPKVCCGGLRRLGLSAIAAVNCIVAFSGCGEPTSPSGGRGGPAAIALAPQLSPAALDAFQVSIVDAVQVDVLRGQDRIASQRVSFDVNEDELRIRVTAELQQPVESLDVGLALLGEGVALFAGGRRLEFRSDGQGTPQTIPLIYLLGGITSLDLQPLDTVLTTLESMLFRLIARDAAGSTISLFYATFTSSDPTVATVGPLGTVLATGLRGQTTIRALAPGNVSTSTIVRVVPLPLPLEKISGDLQTILAGLPLTAPFVVRVLGTDNQSLAGVPVLWQPTTAGGLILPPVSLTDANGLASAVATVGLTPQPYTYTARYKTQSVPFTATATGVPPTISLQKISGDLQSVLPGLALPAPFVVRVLANGQPVVNGAVQWASTSPGGLVVPPLSLTDANGFARTIASVGLTPQTYNYTATYQGQSVSFTATAAGVLTGPGLTLD